MRDALRSPRLAAAAVLLAAFPVGLSAQVDARLFRSPDVSADRITFVYANEWVVEPGGVVPDIEVKDDPTALARGRDPQLEAAIAEALRLLEQNPPVRPTRPAPAVRVPEDARRRP
ncbi:MAG TPA: hypothetical protein VMK65_03140 [Longimicrobiales bacterium]|nr:hypothetical protein [Longimicrobiales bacterium]